LAQGAGFRCDHAFDGDRPDRCGRGRDHDQDHGPVRLRRAPDDRGGLPVQYVRMPIEKESPEEFGYGNIDSNLSESSVTDAVLQDLNITLQDLTLLYCEHRGDRGLREVIAAQYPGVDADDVLVTPGAAAALFMIHTSLLEKGEQIIVEHPNYGTNIETPRAIGARLDLVPLTFENGFQPDLEQFRSLTGPQTKLISITNPHNPTGTLKSQAALQALIDLATANDTYLLVDETYRDISEPTHHPLAATLSDRVISVSSMSKAYGLPGIRIGWIICRNAGLMETFLAAKEQIFITNSVVDEAIARQYLEKRAPYLAAIREQTARNFTILKQWMATQSVLDWVEPQAAVVCFPRFKPELAIDTSAFYRLLIEEYKTFVGPGHWFEMDDRYMRIGYGWPTTEAFEKGLAAIEKAAKRAMR
jgi:aspartate/methionine/tyrosine aminotransferase